MPQRMTGIDARCTDGARAAAQSLRPAVIAIDGPAASGKSTIGFALAELLNFLFFDTGLMYRAVTWVALVSGVAADDEVRVSLLAENIPIDVLPPGLEAHDDRQCTVLIGDEDVTAQLRWPEVDRNVSAVSAMARVRRALSDQQRRIALTYGSGRADRSGIVMVGRDIGTVVMPDAPLKIYMDATPQARADRRSKQLAEQGKPLAWDAVLVEIQRRDDLDRGRRLAPLAMADDAIRIDTSAMTPVEVVCRIVEILRETVQPSREPN